MNSRREVADVNRRFVSQPTWANGRGDGKWERFWMNLEYRGGDALAFVAAARGAGEAHARNFHSFGLLVSMNGKAVLGPGHPAFPEDWEASPSFATDLEY